MYGLVMVAVLLVASANGLLFEYGALRGDDVLGYVDDECTDEILVPSSFTFYGEAQNSIYVSIILVCFDNWL